jgi:hypothetical protein
VTGRFRNFSQLLEEIQRFCGGGQEKVAKIVQCGEPRCSKAAGIFSSGLCLVIFGMDRRIILSHTWRLMAALTGSLNSSQRVVQEEAAHISELVKLVASIFGVTKHV